MAATASKPPDSFEAQPEELRKLVEKIRTRVQREMEPFHKQYRDRWDRLDAIYHTHKEVKVEENDRDRHGGVILHKFGTPFHVPLAFSTIETVIPRILSSAPTQTAKPLDKEAVRACKPIADLINQQQRNMNYELLLQPTVRRALKFGLGVQKVYWCEKKRPTILMRPSPDGGWDPIETERTEYAGPMVEDVDIYDWFWDPSAKSVETCGDIMHRTWRTAEYVKDMVEKGPENGGWLPVDLEAIEGMARSQQRNETWEGRLANQGITVAGENSFGKVHEVWEYHKGDQVTTILDDTFVVANAKNPYHHRQYPFQIYRPTIVEGQLPGKGEIEPLEDLIAELDALRSQRRDAAAYAIQPILAYSIGFIDKKNLKVGPGTAIPVRGDVREALQQLPTQDLPASGYAEENSIKRDVEQTSGISESQMGGSGSGDTAGTETATGMQLVQQAANARIAGKARLMLLEMDRPKNWQFLQLNRQHLPPGQAIRIDDPSRPEGFRFMNIDPEVLNANVELIPEEHSTEPENRVQRINDAMTLQGMAASNPEVDQRRVFKYVLEEYGIKDAEDWFVNPEQPSPEAFAEAIRRMQLEGGLDEETAAQNALEVAEMAQQIQADLNEVEDAGGVPPPGPEPASAGPPPPDSGPTEPEPQTTNAYPEGVTR